MTCLLGLDREPDEYSEEAVENLKDIDQSPRPCSSRINCIIRSGFSFTAMVAPATEIRIEPFSSASIVNTLSMLTRMAVLERFWVKMMKVANVVPSCALGYVNAVALKEPSALAIRSIVHSSLP